MNRLTSRSKTTQSPTERRTLKTAPLLTLDEAIQIASGTNRGIHISKTEIIKAQETVAQAKTNYLPKLDAKFLVGAPLEPLNFRVAIGGTLGRGQLCAPPARIPL